MYGVTVHLRKRYQCGTCRKSYSKLQAAERHAKQCIYSPLNRGCPTCKFETVDDFVGYDCVKGLRSLHVAGRCQRECVGWESKLNPSNHIYIRGCHESTR